jgi:hypothetical protein
VITCLPLFPVFSLEQQGPHFQRLIHVRSLRKNTSKPSTLRLKPIIPPLLTSRLARIHIINRQDGHGPRIISRHRARQRANTEHTLGSGALNRSGCCCGDGGWVCVEFVEAGFEWWVEVGVVGTRWWEEERNVSQVFFMRFRCEVSL